MTGVQTCALPIFPSFVRDIPEDRRSFYSRDTLGGIKRDFYGMTDVQLPDPIPASTRLTDKHRANWEPAPSMIPKLYVYHRSTW